MLINLTELFNSPGKKQEISFPLSTEPIHYGGEEYRIEGQPEAVVTLTNLDSRKVLVQGQVSIELKTVCDRCLKAVTVPIRLDFTHEVSAPDTSGKEKMDEDDQEDETFMEGYELHLSELINNELLLQIPVKVLCREECQGLCPVCGQDLNEGECGCDRFVPDPRWSALQGLFGSEVSDAE
ncbi:MAG: DUF177 domain-containing protein [Lachnospiraceae bacterium]|jgi:uncharacterized protein|nr:DUF177 domain-containing protein [Lachnospiraceae bacterium]